MGKEPGFYIYTGDWKKDPCVCKCSPATRGIWMDLLCAMHDAGRTGKVTGTVEELAVIGRCSVVEMSAALIELKRTKSARVTLCNKNVTVVNRRMRREAKVRELTRKRVKRHRERQTATMPENDVTRPYMPSSLSLSLSCTKVHSQSVTLFEKFWDAYPKKKAKDAARKAFAKRKPDEALLATMLAAIEAQGKTDDWKREDGRYIPYPATWLNQGRWEDHTGAVTSVDSVKVCACGCGQRAVIQRDNRWWAGSKCYYEATI